MSDFLASIATGVALAWVLYRIIRHTRFPR